MVVSSRPAWDDLAELFAPEYQQAVVYADFEQETILHEGAILILPSGWVELPSGRLLSPEAIHHIDTE
jgi:hypothetical protein